MADFRPFRALRYNTSIAGDPSSLVAPPYDVVSESDRARLYERSAYNIARVDYGPDLAVDSESDNRYTRASKQLTDWQQDEVLRLDDELRLYAYDQEFELRGKRMRRRAVFGRLRLEEWEQGIVLPHEVTGAGAKADRLKLLETTRVHLSPIMALYRPDAVPALQDSDLETSVFDAILPSERHTLRPIRPAVAEVLSRSLEDQRLYVADGHHRYETGLSYLNQFRQMHGWSGEEPENFILAALVAADDPGLVVLPTHRLLKLDPFEISLRRLRLYDLDDAGVASQSNVDALVERMARADGPVFGAIGLEPGRLHLLRPRDLEAVLARTPSGRKPEWRRLDVTLLEHTVMPAIGFDGRPEHIDYSEDHRHAAEAVASGAWDVALLLNPTPLEQVFACADAGERMPRKSTFFYPKLSTGVVMLPLNE
jgi:uncharacterized protein (DUF1015 family)